MKKQVRDRTPNAQLIEKRTGTRHYWYRFSINGVRYNGSTLCSTPGRARKVALKKQAEIMAEVKARVIPVVELKTDNTRETIIAWLDLVLVINAQNRPFTYQESQVCCNKKLSKWLKGQRKALKAEIHERYPTLFNAQPIKYPDWVYGR